MPSAAERFLVDFHSRHAGATSYALGDIAMRGQGRTFDSSYDAIVAQLPASAQAVLDLACGDGFLLQKIAQACPQAALAGLDMTEAELAAAGKRLQGRADLRLGRAQALPFGDGTFDAVTCHLALMLMEEPEQVLGEIRRVLKPDGVLVGVVGGQLPASPVLDRYRALLRPAIAQASGVVAIGDRRWRTPDAIAPLVASAGFTDFRHTLLEGDVSFEPPEMWHWLMQMYDGHFLDEATREGLREEFLGTMQGTLHVPVASLLLTARAS